MRTIVELTNVTKDFPLGNVTVRALRGVSLAIEAGDFVTVAGPSGSGKTTMLNQIGCVDIPTAGTVRIDGVSTGELKETHVHCGRLHQIVGSQYIA